MKSFSFLLLATLLSAAVVLGLTVVAPTGGIALSQLPSLPVALQDAGPALTPAPTAGDGANFALEGPRVVVVSELPAPAAAQPGQPELAVVPWRSPGIVSRATGAGGGQAPQANALDSSARSRVPRPLAAPTASGATFEGLDNNDNNAMTGFVTTPPDPQIAAGPNHVLEMVNVVGRIFNKSGGVVSSFTLASFFGVPFGLGTDPKVIYDALSGRWFASYISYKDNTFPTADEGRLHIAVSQTDNPTGAWKVYSSSYVDVFPDYEGIGVTSDKFTVSANVFDIDASSGGPLTAGCIITGVGYCGDQTIVFEKADLIAGAVSPSTFAFPLNLGRFTVRPAHSLAAVNDQYLATFDTSLGLPTTGLTLIRITGTPAAANVTEASATNLTVLSQDIPPPSLTAGPGSIDSGDWRLLEAVWRNGRLWASASAACIPPSDGTTRSCAHLTEVDTGTNAVVQDIMYGASGNYYSWPAIRTDPLANLYVSMTHTNSSIFAEAVAAGRLGSDPVNTMTGSTLLRVGDVVHTSPRWGDYLGAAVDPSLPSCVWVVGQYAKSSPFGSDWAWGTFIAATSYSGGGCVALPPLPGDGDGDGVRDVDEANCGSDPNSAGSRPERIDGVFAGVDDNGDTQVDEALPPGSEGFDCDGDGYKGSAEDHVYGPSTQGDQDPCGTGMTLGWAADLSPGGGPFPSVNKISLPDMTSFLAPVRYINTNVGTNPGDVRWDVAPGKGIFTLDINIADLTSLLSVAPPMLGGARAMNGPACPWPP